MFDAVERLEDGVDGVRVAVAPAPLNIADPDGDAGEFGGEFVDLQPEDVVRAGFHVERRLQAEFDGVDVGAFFDVAQGLEGEVEEISRAAGGVEDAEVVEAEQEGLVGSLGFLWFGDDVRLGGFPLGGERFADQRVDSIISMVFDMHYNVNVLGNQDYSFFFNHQQPSLMAPVHALVH